MSYLIRVVVALTGGLAVLAVVLTVLGFLLSREPPVLSGDADRSYWTRVDFEQVRSGVIVPVNAAAALLNQCSRATVSPVDGYWRPLLAMIDHMVAEGFVGADVRAGLAVDGDPAKLVDRLLSG